MRLFLCVQFHELDLRGLSNCRVSNTLHHACRTCVNGSGCTSSTWDILALHCKLVRAFVPRRIWLSFGVYGMFGFVGCISADVCKMSDGASKR